MRTITISKLPPDEAPLTATTLKASLKENRRISCEACGCSSNNLIVSDGNPIVAAADLAYSRHFPLQLSPDDIWLCLAQGFAIHLRLNAEALRERVVNHSGKVKITVERDHFVKGSPDNDWPGCFAEFSEGIRQHSGPVRDLVVADFSTTGPVERAASEIVLMSAVQNYFEYEVLTLCEIPEFRIAGTVDDWRRIRDRARLFAGYGLETWLKVLLPVLDEFVSVAEGQPANHDFWFEFYKETGGSGGPHVSGWINALFPYLQNRGANEVAFHPNPWVSWEPDSTESLWHGPPCPTAPDFPSGISQAPFIWKYLGHEYAMAFFGGFVGVAQDPATRMIQPVIGWAVGSDPNSPPTSNSGNERITGNESRPKERGLWNKLTRLWRSPERSEASSQSDENPRRS